MTDYPIEMWAVLDGEMVVGADARESTARNIASGYGRAATVERYVRAPETSEDWQRLLSRCPDTELMAFFEDHPEVTYVVDTAMNRIADYPVDLTAEEARAALEGIQRRVTEPVAGRVTTVEVFYGDRWRLLGRTDLMDDVKTSIGFTTDDTFYADPVAYYRDRVRYGARVTDDGFFVVDRFSDG